MQGCEVGSNASNDGDDAMDTSGGSYPAGPSSSASSSPPSSPLTQPPEASAGQGCGVECPRCRCESVESQGAHACCKDYAVQCSERHALHLFACGCGELYFACTDCKSIAANPAGLSCQARDKSVRRTVLHPWVPNPVDGSDLFPHSSCDYGNELPPNVARVAELLRHQAPGKSLAMLMQVVVKECAGRAHLACMHRGYDDGS